MRWSWRIATIAGIGVHVHWTFLILLVWIAGAHFARDRSVTTALAGVGFILALFACVVLHELGHALTAKRYGIRTRDITLFPIGGVARLERIPDDPRQELLVAIAGPAVNVVIAAALFGLILARNLTPTLETVDVVAGEFFAKLMWVNVSLVVFNLIPAFPMDGGRVLRALLALRIDYVKATEVAASIGQALAILFGLLGLFTNHWLLLFIALFVYVGAQEEANVTKMRTLFRGVPVRQVMVRRFRTLSAADTIGAAVDLLLEGCQQDFPVVDDGKVVGILRRNDLIEAVAKGGRESPVAGAMRADCGVVQDTDMLDSTFQRMRESAMSSLPVVHGEQLVGIITLENVGEWAMVQTASKKAMERGEIDDVFRDGGL